MRNAGTRQDHGLLWTPRRDFLGLICQGNVGGEDYKREAKSIRPEAALYVSSIFQEVAQALSGKLLSKLSMRAAASRCWIVAGFCEI